MPPSIASSSDDPCNNRFNYVQGTFSCSFVNNCYYVEPKNTNVVLIALLRVMRIFRIFWIFKNFNLLSINTVIGKLQVSITLLAGGTCPISHAQARMPAGLPQYITFIV